MTSQTLNIAVKNITTSNGYVYVTGRTEIGQLCLLQSDGKTLYFPSSPTATGTPLIADCAIPYQSGSTVTITIPRLSASRVWLSLGGKLTFLLNPGPGLVEPSVTNPSDPNINTLWGFCELTFNNFQLYANISYVDFVSIPIALSLTNASGNVQFVQGLPVNGLDLVCQGLRAQSAVDGKGWNQLIVQAASGQIVRALSPNLGQVLNSSLFAGYYEPYVDAVWDYYSCNTLIVDSQASFGDVQGTVTNGIFNFPSVASYSKPSTSDIFTCSTGPFQTSTAGLAALTPRISAALNRSTLLAQSGSSDAFTASNGLEQLVHTEPADASTYYQNLITNHYSRIVHQTNLDGKGYAFPYDDVAPDEGADQSGSVFDSNPVLLTITVGGGSSAVIASTENEDENAATAITTNADEHEVEKAEQKPLADTSPVKDNGPTARGTTTKRGSFLDIFNCFKKT